ncbi:hypothetical protein [Streptomyces sp. NPDC051180]|uniref:hypothetical protein n=1 Tax=unclassified Streptomyces TaxID=2593676 RepID=UPI0034509683
MDLCCNVYVTTGSPSRLLSTLSGTPGGVRTGPDAVCFAAMSVQSVRDERETGREDATGVDPWSTVLACTSRPGASQDDVIATMADILEALWGAGFGAVASCAYEGRLPRAARVEV